MQWIYSTPCHISDFGDLGLGDHHHDGDDAHHEHRRRRDADPQEAVEKMMETAKGRHRTDTTVIYTRYIKEEFQHMSIFNRHKTRTKAQIQRHNARA